MRMRGDTPSHSHTWLPYITPNGVRIARELYGKIYGSLMDIYDQKKINNASRASPTPKGVYLWTFKNNNS